MRQLAALVFLAILAATTSAHAFEGEKELYEAAKKDKQFTWYTAHYDSETAAAVCKGFEQKYAGIKCDYVRTTAQVAYQRVSQDMKTGLAVASVFSSTDTSHYGHMKKDGWLQPYKPKSLSELIDSFKAFNDPDNHQIYKTQFPTAWKVLNFAGVSSLSSSYLRFEPVFVFFVLKKRN